MAYRRDYDVYENAEITCTDEGGFEITEIREGGLHTYTLEEVLHRWIGAKNITITIEAEQKIPSLEERGDA